MRYIEQSGNFKQQYKLMLKRRKPEAEIKEIIVMLANDTPLPARNKDHNLSGNWRSFRECHIQPDWLLIYKKIASDNGVGVLQLEATGTHADLF